MNNKDRAVLIAEAVALTRPVAEVTLDLAGFAWDCENPLVSLTASQVIANLRRVVAGLTSVKDIVSWAEFIEVRDDVAFDDGRDGIIKEIVHRLASQDTEGPITLQTVADLMHWLDDDSEVSDVSPRRRVPPWSTLQNQLMPIT